MFRCEKVQKIENAVFNTSETNKRSLVGVSKVTMISLNGELSDDDCVNVP